MSTPVGLANVEDRDSHQTRPSLGLRFWSLLASPWCTLALLALLALAGALSLLLPQAGSRGIPVRGDWLAMLQGRYGRWTGRLSSLGLFDIANAWWLDLLLALLAYQSFVAVADSWGRAWRWLGEEAGSESHLPSCHMWTCGRLLVAGASQQSALNQVTCALRELGWRSALSHREESVLVEAIRYPWLVTGRPVVHAGLALVCVSMLLTGRFDWREGPLTLSEGQQVHLANVPGGVLQLDGTGVAQPSDQLYSWVTLLRDGEEVCAGTVSAGRRLSCGKVSIQQLRSEPALHITGYDDSGQPLTIEPMRGDNSARPGVTLSIPPYLTDRYAALPQRGLVFHVETYPDEDRLTLRLGIYRGQQGEPLLRRDIVEPTSFSLDDVTFSFVPTRVPAFQLSHSSTLPLRWAGAGLTIVGLLSAFTLSLFHMWVEMKEQDEDVRLQLWRSSPLPLRGLTIRELEAHLGSQSEAAE